MAIGWSVNSETDRGPGAGILAWLHDHDLVRPSPVLSEDQLRSALDYACLVAALTVARAGADPPWKSELIPA